MSDPTHFDDPLFSFNQQQTSPTVTTPTKQRSNDFFENRSLIDNESCGNHNGNGTNGQGYHGNNDTNTSLDEHHNGNNGEGIHSFSLNNDLFPVDTNENEKSESVL